VKTWPISSGRRRLATASAMELWYLRRSKGVSLLWSSFFDSNRDVVGEDEIEEGQRQFRVSGFEFRVQSSESWVARAC